MKRLKTADDVKLLVVPGVKIKVIHESGNKNNRTYHVRAIVDEDRFVVKCWFKKTQSWVYDVTSIYYIINLAERGVLYVCD